jgi:CRP-like cAMP-binding protein
MRYDTIEELHCDDAASRFSGAESAHAFHTVGCAAERPLRNKAGVSLAVSPLQNRLLAALPVDDYERLLPYLELVALPLGWTMSRPGHEVTHTYFPTTGIVSRQHVMENGSAAASAITGKEGLVGIPMLMGGESPFVQTVVQSAGHAYALKADVLRMEFESGGALQHLLLRYLHTLLTQMGLSAVCNGHHSIEQRICRWLLLYLDRSSSNYLGMTQQNFADFLGVRRESVAGAEKNLQQAGLVRSHRGRLLVQDRAELEARTCECYKVETAESARLLPGRPAQPEKLRYWPVFA